MLVLWYTGSKGGGKQALLLKGFCLQSQLQPKSLDWHKACAQRMRGQALRRDDPMSTKINSKESEKRLLDFTHDQLGRWILVKLKTPVFSWLIFNIVPGPGKEANCASLVNKWVYSIQPVGFANVLRITSLISLCSLWQYSE